MTSGSAGKGIASFIVAVVRIVIYTGLVIFGITLAILVISVAVWLTPGSRPMGCGTNCYPPGVVQSGFGMDLSR